MKRSLLCLILIPAVIYGQRRTIGATFVDPKPGGFLVVQMPKTFAACRIRSGNIITDQQSGTVTVQISKASAISGIAQKPHKCTGAWRELGILTIPARVDVLESLIVANDCVGFRIQRIERISMLAVYLDCIEDKKR